METLDGTDWDVVISGTGFSQSLLALSLSRSGKRILHLDKNDYYGGDEAAFSLSEAETWADRHASNESGPTFSNAIVRRPEVDSADVTKLASSRAYSLALASQLIYARSTLIPALVSSQTHNQLDFQAVGSWFVLTADSTSEASVVRVPSSREDVFQDARLGLKAKRSLMKFLRFVSTYEEQTDTWQDEKDAPFAALLEQKFGLPRASHGPIMALIMSQEPSDATTNSSALPRIARHLRSIGLFGPGFGAVLPKWGGLAELAQVACRACAVGGGVYVLNKGIKSVNRDNDSITLELSEGEKVSTNWLVGSRNDPAVPSLKPADEAALLTVTSRNISVVSSSLLSLFPPTSEGGVTPAGAVVVIPSTKADEPPVHIFAHTSDAGECPMGQCILYASVALAHEAGFSVLSQAVSALLNSMGEQPLPNVLWSMHYQQRGPQSSIETVGGHNHIIVLPPLSQDLSLEDGVLAEVKQAWQLITAESDDAFMMFEARGGSEDDE